MLLAFLHLAARRGEIFRLTWEDVDFNGLTECDYGHGNGMAVTLSLIGCQ